MGSDTMALTQICVLLLTVPVLALSQTIQYPCVNYEKTNPCTGGKVCRLVNETCTTPPCAPVPKCVDPPTAVGSCSVGFYGDPLVDPNNVVIYCNSQKRCPLHTSCNTLIQDIQSTCCWNPQVTTTPIDPCIFTTCLVGTICVKGQCIDPNQPQPDPCLTKNCGPGSRCVVQTPGCSGPPCPPPQAVCILQPCPFGVPAVDSNNTQYFCGRGPTRRQCPPDTYCNIDFVDRFAVCCPNVVTTTTPTPVVDPCARVDCVREDQECRLRQVFCFTAPCPPQPTCVPTQIPSTVRHCPVGRPVLNSNNVPFSCGVGENSPKCIYGTFCNTTSGVCCYQPTQQTTTTAPSCATGDAIFPGSACAPGSECVKRVSPCFVPPCPTRYECVITTTTSAPVIRPCTYTKCGLGTRCVDVYTSCSSPQCPLQARCVDTTPFPCTVSLCAEGRYCVEEAINCVDQPCPKEAKCVAPETTTTAKPVNRPCTFSQCLFGTRCVDVYTSCSNPPCPLEARCISPNPYPCAAMLCVQGSYCVEETLNCVDSPCPKEGKCVAAGSTTTTKPVDRPCTLTDCLPGTRCVDVYTSCSSPPCPLQARCIAPTPFPCTATLCVQGTYCVEETLNCVDGPCPKEAKCVPQQVTTTTTPQDHPCALMFCARGYQCVELRKKCSSPLFVCPVEGKCILTTRYPCTVTRCAYGTVCVERPMDCLNPPCPTEANCVLPVTTTAKPLPNQGDPCAEKERKCGFRYECRVKLPRCYWGLCKAKPTCVRSSSIGGSRLLSCPIGRPMLNSRNEPIRCKSDRNCPRDSGYCFKKKGRFYSACCPIPKATTYTVPPPPLIREGSCPPVAPGSAGTCITTCKFDNSCPGKEKCCSNGCGRTCQAPTDSIYAYSDPCRTKVCGRDQVCRLQQINCFLVRCPTEPVCVAKSSVGFTRRCSQGYSVMNMGGGTVSCRESRSACPDSTFCNGDVCCWDSAFATTTTTTTQRPGTCPRVYGIYSWLFCLPYYYPSCASDNDCTPTTKCCDAGICQKRCMTPQY